MNKLTKGAIAAGAAGVLLLGGLGTIAFWTDSMEVEGGSVTAGTLSLGEPTCDEGWVYAGGIEPVNLIVPGDTISKDCTFLINATGDNLEATLDIPATIAVTGDPADTTLVANVNATYVSSGTAPITPTITEANDSDTVTATIEVEFPFGDATTINANDMQSVIATLDEIPITLTQIP